MITPKHLSLLKSAFPSLAAFGGSAGVLVVFFTSEWKGSDLLRFVPVYNRKYFVEPEKDM